MVTVTSLTIMLLLSNRFLAFYTRIGPLLGPQATTRKVTVNQIPPDLTLKLATILSMVICSSSAPTLSKKSLSATNATPHARLELSNGWAARRWRVLSPSGWGAVIVSHEFRLGRWLLAWSERRCITWLNPAGGVSKCHAAGSSSYLGNSGSADVTPQQWWNGVTTNNGKQGRRTARRRSGWNHGTSHRQPRGSERQSG